MQFLDNGRAGLFIRPLQEELHRLEEFLTEFFPMSDIRMILESIGQNLAIKLDELFLPVVAQSIAEKKTLGLLTGDSPQARYSSFFTAANGQEMTTRFPFLFEMRNRLIEKAVTNIIICLRRLQQNWLLIQEMSLIDATQLKLANVHVSGGDIHGGEQVLILEFFGGKKLVYKPTNLRGVNLMRRMSKFIGFSHSFEISFPKVFSPGEHGWMEFIEFRESDGDVQIQNHFRRLGALLAFAEAFMTSDIIHSNVICRLGEYPTVIDWDVLFRPTPFDRTYPIFRTGIIQEVVPDLEGKISFASALQSIGYYTFDRLRSHPKEGTERTDELEVEFLWRHARQLINNPIQGDLYISPNGYINESIQGYEYGYKTISNRASHVLSQSGWLQAVGEIYPRVILRPTELYFKILRLMQQPIGCTSIEAAKQIARAELEATGQYPELIEHEIAQLVEGDVPYFTQCPAKRDLYVGKFRPECPRIADFYPESAIELLRKNFHNRSQAVMDANVALVREALGKTRGNVRRQMVA